MATIYVGPTAAGDEDGTSWANRYGSLNAAEDRPIQAGDTVYVGAGTYREMLTVDVSGSSGSPITYIGDYTGEHTDGVGGVVRITGSNDDITPTRANAISASSKDYRKFRGFLFDLCTSWNVSGEGVADWVLSQCVFSDSAGNSITVLAERQARVIIDSCYFYGIKSGILFYHSADVADAAHVISNCIGIGYGHSDSTLALIENVGGITIKNCYARGYYRGISLNAVPAAGQTVIVNNCIFNGCAYAVYSVSSGYLLEDYNAYYKNAVDRTNVTVGGNSNSLPVLLDARWFFEMVNGGSMLSPFDLASYSQLVNLAGTSPTSTDMRGTSAIGGTREWGALEYDSTLRRKPITRGMLGTG